MTNLQVQRTKGVLFILLALAIAVSAVFNFRQGLAETAVIKLVAAGFLSYLALRQIQPGATVPMPTSDERIQKEVRAASADAFYLLLSFMLIDQYAELAPAGLEAEVYTVAGIVFLGLGWGYRKLSSRQHGK